MKKNILIVDDKHKKIFNIEDVIVMSPIEYILGEKDYKNTVYNLSSEMGYQDLGYYASLLAMARADKIFPSPKTIQDFKVKKIQKVFSDELYDSFQSDFKKLTGTTFELSIYFGKNLSAKYNDLCWEFFRILQAPLIRLYFKKEDAWELKRIKILSIDDLKENHLDFFKQCTEYYFKNKRKIRNIKNKFIYDLAILHNSKEGAAPSDEKALKNFIKAFKEVKINAELVEYKDKPNITEYDALFIRETTNVSHYTYHLARVAEKEGMVVIDDPDSIVKCTNKIFLEQMMDKLKIGRPKSYIFDKKLFDKQFHQIGYPCVVKQPDSAFSQGVYKATNENELKQITKEVFSKTDLILVQEFVQTDFDWRIGILDNQVIYACKYFMAKGHWQIYNNESKDEYEGEFTTVDVKDVDDVVLKTALKATRSIGKGLYGVDLKQRGKDVYLIEVNDNPSIDSNIEDQLLGEELYLKVANYFLKELNKKRGLYGI